MPWHVGCRVQEACRKCLSVWTIALLGLGSVIRSSLSPPTFSLHGVLASRLWLPHTASGSSIVESLRSEEGARHALYLDRCARRSMPYGVAIFSQAYERKAQV